MAQWPQPEYERLAHEGEGPLSSWDKWGPYVAERAWGTVREDYSPDGDAWRYFPFDHAHLRAYRRGEDGIAGFCDQCQVLLITHAFWNGNDPILKERLFGLDPSEGNHGEDVKEIYYHLDALPDHSYMKFLYKYPQNAFPYEQLRQENRQRGVDEPEYELLDTGIFKENRYFDIFIEYAKPHPEEVYVKIEACNRGSSPAPLHMLPHLFFRNQWSWRPVKSPEPTIRFENGALVADDSRMPSPRLLIYDYHLGPRYLYSSPGGTPLFTNNDSNNQALFGSPNHSPYVRDAFHRYLIKGEKGAVNPAKKGTKSALHYFFPAVAPGASVSVMLRLTPNPQHDPLTGAEELFIHKRQQADAYYASLHPEHATEEEKAIQRQALAGMIWNKQLYIFDVHNWLSGDDPATPPPPERESVRNTHWRHFTAFKILSMPDKWEFPWFAAWDLVFHSVALGLVDLPFAKAQLRMLLLEKLMHPNGAIPAYEWEFSDVNPPLQAWGALKLFEMEKAETGVEDFEFLERCFHKLLLNFAWWINRVDALGNNVFEGGFLGMDNIGFTDRSQKPPPGYLVDQADGAGWMSLLCLNLMRISLILARKDRSYECLGTKFFYHFIYITAAMRKGYWRSYDMWSEQEAFFHSYLRCPDGSVEEIDVHSLVGLIPFFACDVWDDAELQQFPVFYKNYQWALTKRPALVAKCVQTIPHSSGHKHLLGLLDTHEIQRFLQNIWRPEEFCSDYGIRSLSKRHLERPAELLGMRLAYEPGEAKDKIKGGNSNWRGPIWYPINYILIDTLRRLHSAFGNDLQVPLSDGRTLTAEQMAQELGERLLNLFKKDSQGKRPCFGSNDILQTDPHFHNHLLFFEYFHGDTGRGLGASHQTGWTGLIANLVAELRRKG